MTRGVAIVRRKIQKPNNVAAYSDFLMHYGISGQRWGLRRYQNEDGTLTEEGKLRYNEGRPESETWNKNEAKYLTDRELQRRNNRLNQERIYKEALTSEAERNAKQVKNDIIKKVIAGTAISLAAVAMRGHWKQAASFIGKHGKSLLTKLKAPIVRSINKNKLSKQTLGSTLNRAVSRYDGLNRPPLGARQYYPQSIFEYINKKRIM